MSRALAANELVLVAAPGLLAGDDLVALAAATWLLREPGSGTRDTMLGYLADRELAPPQLTLGANGAVIAGAVAGLGVTLASAEATAREVEQGVLEVVQAPGMPMSRPWHLVTRADVPAPTRLFLGHVLDADPDADPDAVPDAVPGTGSHPVRRQRARPVPAGHRYVPSARAVARFSPVRDAGAAASAGSGPTVSSRRPGG